MIFEYRHDAEDRRMKASLSATDDDGDTFENAMYASTKHFAMSYGGTAENGGLSDPPAEAAWYQRTTDNWVVWSTSGYLLVEGDGTVSLSDDFVDQEWRIENGSSDDVSLTLEGADIATLGEDERLSEHSTVEVTIHRETGYVTRIEQELSFDRAGSDEERTPVRTVVEFDEWETYDLDRPEEIDTVRSLEVAWAIAYY